MKLFNKTDEPFLTKTELRKVFLATSIMVLVIYIVAMFCSLNGLTYFLANYSNPTMDKIEGFMRAHGVQSLISCLFLTLEFSILLSFISHKIESIFYSIGFYGAMVGLSFLVPTAPSIVYTVVGLGLCILIPFFKALVFGKNLNIKLLIRVGVALLTSFVLQIMIYAIKSGVFSATNNVMTMAEHFVYAIEYDIALSVLLFTASLYIDRGKGDSKKWATYHTHSGFSQTSKTRLQKSASKKNLSKKQKNKLFWLWARLYLIQVLGFAFIMILPFLIGKVVEFLVMYLAFAIVRYILGFKYSLHFKNEFLCLTVGAVVFGILTLAVPFFYVEIIIAVLLGCGLATFLHLSYKYKGFWLFAKMAKPDKFATLYVIFDGDLSEKYIHRQCRFKGLDEETTKIVFEYMEGYKLSYLAFRFNYATKTIDRKLTEAIEVLNK